MPVLNVPHVRQAGPTHCGAACLEMVYRYFGITNRTQHDIWCRNTFRPDGTGHYLSTQAIIDDLINNGFLVLCGQILLENKKCNGSLIRTLNNELPIIACKQWNQNPSYGHFVVITGLENNTIIYLDPETNSVPKRKILDDFMNEWRATGPEVIGGQFIIMGNNTHELNIQRLHVTNFTVPRKLKSFCLDSVSLQN
jgi:ABC-type bacteriocin/lantibiotic exporter with double-glycine peptidase domain